MKRLDNEDYKEYKVRRTEANKNLKSQLKGKMVWFSVNNRNPGLNQGTYIKEK